MGLRKQNGGAVRCGKTLVIAAAVFAVSCGKGSGEYGGMPKSAVMPRPGVTLRVTGDTLVSSARQDSLLALARRSIARYLQTGTISPMPLSADDRLMERRGCLIKLIKADTVIRGASGYILPVKALAAAAEELSMRAASGGQRFSPLKQQELDSTVIQISVVSEPVTITRDTEVLVGRHGLVLKNKGMVAGILLVDDVARSGKADEAVDRLFSLGRMTRKDWVAPKVVVQKFTMQVFQEKRPVDPLRINPAK